MDLQNLAYAATQIVHNFGAVAVVGGAACALVWRDPGVHHRLAWLVLAGWATQAASGALFGAISYCYYGKFPDIHDIALAALGVKMLCAGLGFILAAWLLFVHPAATLRRRAWAILFGLGALALSSAAVLRWFS